MSEPEPGNCKRCGKLVMVGTVEEMYLMQLNPRPLIPYEEALLLHKHKIPLVELLIRKAGSKVVVTSSRLFYPSETQPEEWKILKAHDCDWNKWGKP